MLTLLKSNVQHPSFTRNSWLYSSINVLLYRLHVGYYWLFVLYCIRSCLVYLIELFRQHKMRKLNILVA